MSNLIYLADNDLGTCRRVKDFLQSLNFDVECFETGDQLFNAFQHKPCDLAILNSVMPSSDGFLIGAKLKQQMGTPVIVLTPPSATEDHAFSVSLGLDAYLTKPFCLSKLTTYVKALLIKNQLRHVQAQQGAMTAVPSTPAADERLLEYADVAICKNRRMALCNGVGMSLTGTELQLLTLLLTEGHRAVSRKEMIDTIWGAGKPVNHRVTDDIVKRLRKKLKSVGSQVIIDTVWGFGFRLGTA